MKGALAKAARIACLILIPAQAGCGTIIGLSTDEYSSKVYAGWRWHFDEERQGEALVHVRRAFGSSGMCEGIGFFCVIFGKFMDIPASLAADTLLLPFTLTGVIGDPVGPRYQD